MGVVHSDGTKRIWLMGLLIHLALITGASSFNSRRLPVAYGSYNLATDQAARIQQQAWESFAARRIAPDAPDLLHVYSSRILVPGLIALAVKSVGMTWDRAFSLFRLLSIIASYIALFSFLQRRLTLWHALAGCLFMGATIHLTFNNMYEIPTEFPEILLFTLGLWCIVERRNVLLCAVILIATFNRETSCFLALILLFHRWSWPLRWRTVGVVAAAGFSWLLPLLWLRWWMMDFRWPYGDSIAHNLPGLLRLFENFNPYNNYLYYFYLFGVLWFFPYYYWHKQSAEIRRILMAVPILAGICMFGGGYLDEPREIVFFYPVLLLASLDVLWFYPAEILKADGLEGGGLSTRQKKIPKFLPTLGGSGFSPASALIPAPEGRKIIDLPPLWGWGADDATTQG